MATIDGKKYTPKLADNRQKELIQSLFTLKSLSKKLHSAIDILYSEIEKTQNDDEVICSKITIDNETIWKSIRVGKPKIYIVLPKELNLIYDHETTKDDLKQLKKGK